MDKELKILTSKLRGWDALGDTGIVDQYVNMLKLLDSIPNRVRNLPLL